MIVIWRDIVMMNRSAKCRGDEEPPHWTSKQCSNCMYKLKSKYCPDDRIEESNKRQAVLDYDSPNINDDKLSEKLKEFSLFESEEEAESYVEKRLEPNRVWMSGGCDNWKYIGHYGTYSDEDLSVISSRVLNLCKRLEFGERDDSEYECVRCHSFLSEDEMIDNRGQMKCPYCSSKVFSKLEPRDVVSKVVIE